MGWEQQKAGNLRVNKKKQAEHFSTNQVNLQQVNNMAEDHLREVTFLRHEDGPRFTCKLRKNFRIMFICVKILKTRESWLLKTSLGLLWSPAYCHGRSLNTGDSRQTATLQTVTETMRLKAKVALF